MLKIFTLINVLLKYVFKILSEINKSKRHITRVRGDTCVPKTHENFTPEWEFG